PVVPDAAPVDLGGQPARGKADGPGQIGVDALPSGDPVEEPRPGCFRSNPVATTTLADILADVVGGRMAVGRRDSRAGQDTLRRAGEASVLVLISLAGGPKHGYAL